MENAKLRGARIHPMGVIWDLVVWDSRSSPPLVREAEKSVEEIKKKGNEVGKGVEQNGITARAAVSFNEID